MTLNLVKKQHVIIALLVLLSFFCLTGCSNKSSKLIPPSTLEDIQPVTNQYTVKEFDQSAFRQFLDEFMTSNIDMYHVPGLTFSMVKDGNIFLEKGYGYSDVENKTLVDPTTHIFRIASLSKAFTAHSVLLLSEKGVIDLDTSINSYIKPYKVPEDNGKITVKHLLQHASGLELL